ncbi:MAG: protein translocase subunit SecF [Chitinivibrionales bacterium]|nr:protein translocase subunit SecF [Chitinivibrionales bacterium]
MIDIFRSPNFNFLGVRKYMYFVSGFLILATFVSLIVNHGFNLAIDFVGGTLVHLKFEQPVDNDIAKIRTLINKLGYGEPEIKTLGIGHHNELQITVKKKAEGSQIRDQIQSVLKSGYPQNSFEILKQETVGAKVSNELAWNAMLAILLSWIAIILYIAVRFKFPHGIAAVAGLIHDCIITTGVFTLRNAEISLSFVAAILTVIGYSLNDTIVVFDRVRENHNKGFSAGSFENMINASINQTLSRTIITILTVLFVVTTFYFLGGEATRDLSLAMIVGTIVGTYSTYFVSSPLLLAWNTKWPIKAH